MQRTPWLEYTSEPLWPWGEGGDDDDDDETNL